MGNTLNEPKTYIGVDSEGKELCRYQAADANKDINPVEVSEKAQNVSKKTGELISGQNGYNKKLEDLKKFSYTALIVKDFDFEDTIDAVKKSTKTLKKQIVDYMDQITEESYKAHNQIQKQYNNDAREKASSYSGVVDVKRA